jgi:hypothetical protein
MKRYEEKEIYCLDDVELQKHLASNLGRYYSSDLVEQRDYSLEGISCYEDGINISLRVENLYNSESYLVQRVVA